MTAIGFIVALLATSARAGLATVPASTTLQEGRSSYAVQRAQVIVDPSRSLEFDGVRKLDSAGKARWAMRNDLNFGFSNNRYWLKFHLSNLDSATDDWALEFGYPMFQHVRFYQVTNGKVVSQQSLGRLQPFGARPVDHWNFVFDFKLPRGGQSDVYVMLQSVGHMDAAMNIYTHDALLSKSLHQAMGMGLYCGIILAMVLYNFFLFISIRDRNYLLYIVYALTLCLLQCTLNGTTYQFLWPNWVAWNNISAPVFAGVGYLFLGLFTKSLLDTKKLVPRLNIAVDFTIAASILLIGWSLFFYGVNVNRFTSLLQICVPFILLPVSIGCAMMGSPVAIYYSLAFGAFFLGSGVLAAGFIGWIPRNIVTVNSMYFGSAAETILLSLALAARIKLLKDEKLESELKAAEVARQLSESEKQLERQMAVSALASQVAHDIKSPLAALDVVEKELSQLSEGTRLLIRGAVSRIRDIANNLVQTNRGIRAEIAGASGASVPSAEKASPSIELVSSHIDPLITEKRLQFRGKIGVEIGASLGESSYGLFARIIPSEFKRDLSNLINNAVEAVGERGRVWIDLALEDGKVLVTVNDNGKGIAAEVLSRLGQRGETHGKPGGLGLGIYQAKQDAESWGGSLGIDSTSGKGTAVSLRLPQAAPPSWFVARLDLKRGCPVVILDDDSSIHQVWQGRFGNMAAKDIAVLHFSTPGELRAWVRANAQASRQALYLTDYEILGSNETGLDTIEELGLGRQSILVTSHYDEKQVLADCARLSVRLIPKGLAGFVPIKISDGPNESWDAILIDDDALARTTWKMSGSRSGKKVCAFATAAEFLDSAAGFDRLTPVYVDAELAGGVKGAHESKRIHEMGFTEIYLATGHEPAAFAELKHLRGVVGKEPPWS